MAQNRIGSDIVFTGDVQMTGTGSVPAGSVTENSLTATCAIPRSKLAQDTLASFALVPRAWFVHDAPQTGLPNPSANDDLGIYGATFGTACPYLASADLKTAGATSLYARILFELPPSYDDGQTLVVRLHAGMITTVADNTATADVECYLSDDEGAKSGSDLCATGAQSINSLTFADKDFTITATGLEPGDVLDIRVTVAVNDASSGTAVIAAIGKAAICCDIRG